MSHTASAADIKKAYHKLALKLHWICYIQFYDQVS
ncbi:MAG: hypothetical protein AAGC85_11090 [Bacteroidota bacterium]